MTATKLKVPWQAEDAFERYTYRAKKRPESADDSIRAIATPVVVAELRGWVDACDFHGFALLAQALRARILVLEAEQ